MKGIDQVFDNHSFIYHSLVEMLIKDFKSKFFQLNNKDESLSYDESTKCANSQLLFQFKTATIGLYPEKDQLNQDMTNINEESPDFTNRLQDGCFN